MLMFYYVYGKMYEGCRLYPMKAPEFRHRSRIETFCRDEAERLGHTVLLLPVADPLVVPESMPPGFIRKDREGRLTDPSRLVAFSPQHAFDIALPARLAYWA